MIVRFYDVSALGRTGKGAIAPAARYCAVLWRGEHRIERRHLPGGAWAQLERDVTEASSRVESDSEVWRALAGNDPHAEVLATSMTDLTAAPTRVPAAIDAALRESF